MQISNGLLLQRWKYIGRLFCVFAFSILKSDWWQAHVITCSQYVSVCVSLFLCISQSALYVSLLIFKIDYVNSLRCWRDGYSNRFSAFWAKSKLANCSWDRVMTTLWTRPILRNSAWFTDFSIHWGSMLREKLENLHTNNPRKSSNVASVISMMMLTADIGQNRIYLWSTFEI